MRPIIEKYKKIYKLLNKRVYRKKKQSDCRKTQISTLIKNMK